MNHFNLFIIVGFVFFIIASCDKEPVVPNEDELITTFIYTLTPISGGDVVELSFTDLDGDGGQSPVIVAGQFSAESAYTGVIQLLNESVSPSEDIAEEIMEEGDEHQFFFHVETAIANILYTDQDVNGNPIGLTTTLTTGAISDGILTITLRHQLDKFASDVSMGDITNAGGETDIEVSFPMVIK